MTNLCSFGLYFNEHAPCGVYCKRCPEKKECGCKGCREQGGQVKSLPICKTYECVTGKGYNFCHECEEFPCEKLQPIVNYENFLPHNSKIYNLLLIKKYGIVEWNRICEEKAMLYYSARKIKYGGDDLTLASKEEIGQKNTKS